MFWSKSLFFISDQYVYLGLICILTSYLDKWYWGIFYFHKQANLKKIILFCNKTITLAAQLNFYFQQPDLKDQRAVDNMLIALDATENKGEEEFKPLLIFQKGKDNV